VTDVVDRPVGAGDEWPGGVDAFRVLGLPYSPDLTDEDVRRAYLLRLKAVHPDRGGDTQAAAAVTAAYEALRSGVRRGELLAAATVDRGSIPPTRRGEGGRRGGRGPGRPRGSGAAPRGVAVPDAARREELRARVAASRAAQGLPPFVTDEATLDKISDLLVVMLGRRDDRGRRTPRSVGSAWPGWDGPWWDEDAGQPRRVEEESSWRLSRRRRRLADRELAWAGRLPVPVAGGVLRRAWLRLRHGRPVLLLARVAVAAGVPLIAEAAVPGDPAIPALAVGAFTWLVLTGRLDLAPRQPR
jgi:curved DNA-binding protein CbpA